MTHVPPGPGAPESPRRRDPKATRDRLVRAAVELFTAQGYHACTTPEIAARAGVAEGTIYRHFNSKEHLLNEVYREAVRQLQHDIVNTPRGLRCREVLDAIAEKWRQVALRDPALVSLVFGRRWGDLLDPKSRQAFAEFKGELGKVIAAGKAAGQVRPGAVDLWTDVWLALVVLMLRRTTSREWPAAHPAPLQVMEAAWDAIKRTE